MTNEKFAKIITKKDILEFINSILPITKKLNYNRFFINRSSNLKNTLGFVLYIRINDDEEIIATFDDFIFMINNKKYNLQWRKFMHSKFGQEYLSYYHAWVDKTIKQIEHDKAEAMAKYDIYINLLKQN